MFFLLLFFLLGLDQHVFILSSDLAKAWKRRVPPLHSFSAPIINCLPPLLLTQQFLSEEFSVRAGATINRLRGTCSHSASPRFLCGSLWLANTFLQGSIEVVLRLEWRVLGKYIVKRHKLSEIHKDA